MKMHEILLIDDDPVINFINDKVIRSVIFDKPITIFKDGFLALKYIRDNPDKIFLIFLDIHMPEMTGWDFIEIISNEKLASNLSIYILTSSIDKTDLKKSEENNLVISYLAKPLKVDFLKTLILK